MVQTEHSSVALQNMSDGSWYDCNILLWSCILKEHIQQPMVHTLHSSVVMLQSVETRMKDDGEDGTFLCGVSVYYDTCYGRW